MKRRNPADLRLAVKAGLVLLVGVGSAADAAAQTERLSVTAEGAEGNDNSGSVSVSRTGRFVAFMTAANNLADGDRNGSQDVMLRDRKKSTLVRLSVNASGAEGSKASFDPGLSASGRLVVFTSAADNLVPDDENGMDDVFVRDTKTGVITRVSLSTTGVEGDAYSGEGALSASGRYVVFESDATTLVEDDGNFHPDVFLHDRKTGQTTRLSVNAEGEEGDDFSGDPSISANGRYVAFTSVASNFVPLDGNGKYDIFLLDRKTGAITRLSVASDGEEGNEDSGEPVVSANGRFIAFITRADNLVEGDDNDVQQVLVCDRKTGALERVSVDPAGLAGDFFSDNPSLSANGRFVAFDSLAGNLVADDGNGKHDIFVRDRKKAITIRASVDAEGNDANDISFLSGIGMALSGSGRFIGLTSAASDLVSGDVIGKQDVFVRDLKP